MSDLRYFFVRRAAELLLAVTALGVVAGVAWLATA